VRQISPGDRRLLAEFALGFGRTTADRDLAGLRDLSDLLLGQLINAGSESSVGFAALESNAAGDRVIGATAFAPVDAERAVFGIAVAAAYREEQVGHILLSTLIRQAKRMGVPKLVGEMAWSNRPMQMLAMSMGFSIEPLPRDRTRRRLTLSLK
jgi:RimJ/RimL family protein N-acetyltransferase